jgi:hypothetical protein
MANKDTDVSYANVMSTPMDENLLAMSFNGRKDALNELQMWAKGCGFAVKVSCYHIYCQ